MVGHKKLIKFITFPYTETCFLIPALGYQTNVTCTAFNSLRSFQAEKYVHQINNYQLLHFS